MGETGGMMGSNANQPPTTEYTLQGWCSDLGDGHGPFKADTMRPQV